jgi:hypothetical protein
MTELTQSMLNQALRNGNDYGYKSTSSTRNKHFDGANDETSVQAMLRKAIGKPKTESQSPVFKIVKAIKERKPMFDPVFDPSPTADLQNEVEDDLWMYEEIRFFELLFETYIMHRFINMHRPYFDEALTTFLKSTHTPLATLGMSKQHKKLKAKFKIFLKKGTVKKKKTGWNDDNDDDVKQTSIHNVSQNQQQTNDNTFSA